MERNKRFLNRVLSIVMACMMILNVPMSVLASETAAVTEAVTESATETETETATEAATVTEEVTEAPNEVTEAPTEATEEPTEATTEAPTEAPSEEATEAPTEVTEAPTEATEAPTEETEAPTEAPSEEATEEPTEAPSEEATEAPTEATEEATETPTEPTEEATETPTEPTEEATETPTEEATEAPTESTEEPTETPTEEATEAPTESTEAPTETTEASTEETEASVEITEEVKNEAVALLAEEETTTPAADAVVKVTISNQGVIAKDKDDAIMANRDVTVKDINSDGVLTYDEALVAAHTAYNSADGYVTDEYVISETEKGVSVSKLWGVETYNTLYYLNNEKLENHVGHTETSVVSAGDYLVASINQDETYDSDRYSWFNATTATVTIGKELTLTLNADLSTGNSVLSGISIGTWKDGGFTAMEGKTTGSDGSVILTFDEAGTYYVTASGKVSDTVTTDWVTGATATVDCPIIAPVCIVTVPEPAAPAVVKMTVSDQGVLASAADGSVMAYKEVTVTDINKDTVLSYDEALVAAHAAYNSADGYATTEGEWGLQVTKLWGTETTNTVFYKNHTALSNNVGDTAVAAGDYLAASVNKDATYYSDRYTYFNRSKKTVYTGEELTLTLKGNLYNGTAGAAGVSVGTWSNGAFTAIDGAITDEKGNVTLTFAEAGTYIVTANGTVSDTTADYTAKPVENWVYPTITHDCPIIAPYCVVIVEQAAETNIASGSCGATEADDVNWALSSEGVLTISGTGAMANYASYNNLAPWSEYKDEIKSVVVESGVTSIGNYAFNKYTKLTSVTLADTVNTIGNYAFIRCEALNSVQLSNGLESIGNYAFQYCTALESLTLPERLTTLANSVFRYSGLKNLVIPDSVTSIGSYLVGNSTKLESITFGEGMSQIPPNVCQDCTALTSVNYKGVVTTIGASAFRNCIGLKNIVIPETCTTINAYAYAGSGLESVTIPATVTGMTEYSYAFRDCTSLKTAVIKSDAMGKYIFWGCTALNKVTFGSGVTQIPMYAFYNCTALETVTIPTSVTTIGREAFRNTGLTSITIPATVTDMSSYVFRDCTALESAVVETNSLGGYTFNGCTALKSLTFGKNVTEIKESALRNTSLISIAIPEGITTIGNYAFADNAEVTSITLPSTVASIGTSVFANCPKLTEIKISGENFKIQEGILYTSNMQTLVTVISAEDDVITVPEGVTEIAAEAFKGNTSVKVISLPSSLVTIGTSAFADCTALTSISLPESVTVLGESVFSGCTALTSVYMAGVTEIGAGAFNGCTSLVSTIGSRMTKIGANAYNGCTALTSYSISASVTEIGESAFAGTGLKSVKIPATVTAWGSKVFEGCASLASVTIESTLTALPEAMFSNCTALTEVVLPSGLTEIPGSLFSGCTALTKVDIPGGVTKIGTSAFNNCEALASVTFPSGLKEIGNQAFNKCKLIAPELPEDLETIGHEAFSGCGYTSVTIPASLTSIGNSSFKMKGLENVTFAAESKLTEIASAFNYSGIKSIDIPEGVTKIGWAAFRGCSNLESVNIPDTVTYIDGQVFCECTSLKKITVPSSVTELGNSLLSGCTSIVRAEIYANITSIPFMTFSQCTVLQEIVLPATITDYADSSSLDNLKVAYFMGTEEQWNAIAFTGLGGNPYKNKQIVYNYDPEKTSEAPVITTQPEGAEYTWAATPKPLKIEATAAEGATMIFNWYVSDTNSTEDGKGVVGVDSGNSSELTITCDTIGTKYYYCEVKAIKDGAVASTISEVVKVTVTGEENKVAFAGEGTAESPYLLNTAEDLQLVYNYVACGYHFEDEYLLMTADITLPVDWKPIGVLKNGATNAGNGKNILNFRGNFDGGNHTVTIAEGGLPLFGYVYHSSISNLNIYGKQIAGAGLINNYTVDYGPNGVYNANIAICDITNVTLKSGSATQYSGLVQGNGSGINLVNFTNCTVESGVTVGYGKDSSNIGSFISCLNGTMNNCVSYADVFGKDKVGGLAGSKGQSMGPCSFVNCSFKGTVTAAGNYAGGILASGYDGGGSAPNTPCVTIKNCYVSGTITGADYVGGILGGENGCMQNWANGVGYIQDNLFDGTINSAGSYVGGIIGYMPSLNRYNVITNNYYYGEQLRGIGFMKYIDTNHASPAQIEGVTYFNTETSIAGAPSGVAKTGHNRTDDPLGADAKTLAACADGETTVLDKLNGSETSNGNWMTDETTGRPALSDKVFIQRLEISGDYKTSYVIGEELDLTGMLVVARWSDGKETELSVSELSISGYDSTIRGEQTVILAYGAAKAEIKVTVLKKVNNTIEVSFTLLGDSVHDSDADKNYHTLTAGNLETWIPETVYEVDLNATVLDVLEKALAENDMTLRNEDGNYVQGITKDGVELAEFTNGKDSGWMYTLNGIHPDLSVIQQYLEDGDVLIFHYTDYYHDEHDHIWSTTWTTDENGHWHACVDWCPIEDNTKKDGYAVHTASDWIIDNAETGSKHKECTVCGYVMEKDEGISVDEAQKQAEACEAAITALPAADKLTLEDKATVEAARAAYNALSADAKAKVSAEVVNKLTAAEAQIAALEKEAAETDKTPETDKAPETDKTPETEHTHKFGEWTTVSEATVFAKEVQERTCTTCKEIEKQEVGKKLTPTIKVTASKIILKKGQSTTKFKVTGLANGDSVKSMKSSNKKIFKVNKKTGKITAKKVGKAKLIITLASGLTKKVTVKVQKKAVKTTKIVGLTKKLTMIKGTKVKLTPELKPFTSLQKITYASNKKTVVSVTKKGVLKAKKTGKAKITVKSGSKKFVITVTVKKAKKK